MQDPGCLNCGAALLPGQKFCPACGQQTTVPRINGLQLLKDFLRVFTHAEKGIFNLLKGLAISPGKVAAEYVGGRRKKYFNPFTFLAICIAFMTLLNNQIKPYGALPAVDPVVMSRMPDENMKQLYLLTVKRNATGQNFLNKNINLITVLVAPFFAFSLWIFFRRRGRNMAEISVAYILLSGFSNVVSTILFSPFLAMTRDTKAYNLVLWGTLLVQTLYYTWGMKSFFGYHGTGSYFKILGVLILGGIIGLILFFLGYFIYVYHGSAISVFQYLGNR